MSKTHRHNLVITKYEVNNYNSAGSHIVYKSKLLVRKTKSRRIDAMIAKDQTVIINIKPKQLTSK